VGQYRMGGGGQGMGVSGNCSCCKSHSRVGGCHRIS
jgi:hypothetical protein